MPENVAATPYAVRQVPSRADELPGFLKYEFGNIKRAIPNGWQWGPLSGEVGVTNLKYYYGDVRRYGAAVDDSTDDAGAYKDAVASMRAIGGGVVYVPWGISRLGSVVALPVDQSVVFVGQGQGLIDAASPVYQGSVLRRASGYTGAMFTQTGSAGNIRGVHFSNLSFAGDLQSGNCLELEYLNLVQFDCVTFHEIAGHAVRGRGILNSWLRQCRFYRCGDATHETMVLDATTIDAVGSQGVDFFGCTFENSKGTDLLLTNATNTATVGTDNINIIGGKFEQSNTTGIPGTPLIKVVANQKSYIQTAFQNGQSHGATHLQIGESGNAHSIVRELTVNSTFSVFSATDADNPQYLIDVQDGGANFALRGITLKGTFHRGGGNSGAQIRVPAGLVNRIGRIMIDPTNTYDSVLSGIPISGIASGPAAVSTDHGDATATIITGIDAPTQRWDTALTAARTCHVSLTSESATSLPAAGVSSFRIIHRTASAFNLTVLNGFGGSTIKAMPSGTWLDIQFDGTNWVETANGTL